MRLIRSKINAYLDETEEQRKGERKRKTKRERAQPILFSRKITEFSVAHTIESSHIAKRTRNQEGTRKGKGEYLAVRTNITAISSRLVKFRGGGERIASGKCAVVWLEDDLFSL